MFLQKEKEATLRRRRWRLGEPGGGERRLLFPQERKEKWRCLTWILTYPTRPCNKDGGQAVYVGSSAGEWDNNGDRRSSVKGIIIVILLELFQWF